MKWRWSSFLLEKSVFYIKKNIICLKLSLLRIWIVQKERLNQIITVQPYSSIKMGFIFKLKKLINLEEKKVTFQK